MLRGATCKRSTLPNALVMSSLMPSLKYSSSSPRPRFSNGSTAIEGRASVVPEEGLLLAAESAPRFKAVRSARRSLTV